MNHTPSHRTRFSSFALGSILAIGAAATWFVVSGMVQSIAEQWLSRRAYEYVVITRTADALIQRNEGSDSTIRTLDGQPVLDQNRAQEGSGGFSSPKNDRRMRSDLYGWAARIISYRDTHLPPTYWYLVTSDEPGGRGYFAGFDSRSKLAVGYLGLAGFRSDVPPLEEQFDGEATTAGQIGRAGEEPPNYGFNSAMSPALFLVSEGSLYRFDLSERSVRKIALPSEVKSVCDLPEMSKAKAGSNEKRDVTIEGTEPVEGGAAVFVPMSNTDQQDVAARAADKFYVLSLGGDVLREIAIPEAIRTARFELFHWSDGATVFSTGEDHLSEVYWTDSQGRETRHETLQLSRPDEWANFRSMVRTTAIELPFPALLAFVYLVIFPRTLVIWGQAPSFTAAIGLCMSEAWLPLLLVCLLAVALALLVVRRQRLYAERGTAGWVLLVLLMGPAGLIGYLVHRHWPVLRRCGTCGATIPSDRLECAVCEADMPLPARKGIEVVA